MMDLEQDAMLTAIGQMSMEEAREKWADRWSEFVQSMSRWKSVHTLLRLARLNAMDRELKKQFGHNIASEVETSIRLVEQNMNAQEIWDELTNIYDIWESKEKAERVSRISPNDKTISEDDINLYKFLYPAPTHRGKHGTKQGYVYQVAAAIKAASLAREYVEAGGDVKLYALRAEYKASTARARKLGKSFIASIGSDMDIIDKRLQIIDEYDITKPYAMGLLVADIFKSMAMAIEGEIY